MQTESKPKCCTARKPDKSQEHMDHTKLWDKNVVEKNKDRWTNLNTIVSGQHKHITHRLSQPLLDGVMAQNPNNHRQHYEAAATAYSFHS